jgi:hypothetical protein
MPKTIVFRNEVFMVTVFKYDKFGNMGIQLYDTDNIPFMRVSVNPDYKLRKGLIAINDFGFRKGILEALVKAGIVSTTIESIHSFMMHVTYEVCTLLWNGEDETDETVLTQDMVQ